jgi:hypothetical protein
VRGRPARTPCLGERLSALADGSMRADVLARALAHTLTCPTCRDGLQAELRLRERLQASAAPDPSEGLLAGLIALGGPQGPVPGRRSPGPQRSAFSPAAFGPVPAGAIPPAPPDLVSSLAAGRMVASAPGGRPSRRPGRMFATAALSALGVGAVAAGVLVSPASPPQAPPLSDLTVRRTAPGGGPAAADQQRFAGGGSGAGPLRQPFTAVGVRRRVSPAVVLGWPEASVAWAVPAGAAGP